MVAGLVTSSGYIVGSTVGEGDSGSGGERVGSSASACNLACKSLPHPAEVLDIVEIGVAPEVETGILVVRAVSSGRAAPLDEEPQAVGDISVSSCLSCSCSEAQQGQSSVTTASRGATDGAVEVSSAAEAGDAALELLASAAPAFSRDLHLLPGPAAFVPGDA